jgi:hypothetical protein
LKQIAPNLDLIQVTCTARIAPKLLEITFSSFSDGLLSQFKQKELFINIDPIGGSKNQIDDVLIICNKYFDSVTFNCPSVGNFSKAAKWAWEQVNAEFFLHLEDDWLLNKKISKTKLIHELFSTENVASVRLNKQRSIKDKCLQKISLNPILIKTTYIKQALSLYSENLDPEKQLSIPPLSNHLKHWKHLAYGEKKRGNLEGGFVTDIGKYWRKSQGLTKLIDQNKSTWHQKESSYIDILKSFVFYKTLKLRQIINQMY